MPIDFRRIFRGIYPIAKSIENSFSNDFVVFFFHLSNTFDLSNSWIKLQIPNSTGK